MNVGREWRTRSERDEFSRSADRRADACHRRQSRGIPVLRRPLVDRTLQDAGHHGVGERHDDVERSLSAMPLHERRERSGVHVPVSN